MANNEDTYLISLTIKKYKSRSQWDTIFIKYALPCNSLAPKFSDLKKSFSISHDSVS